MATPKVVTDGTTVWEEAELNKFLSSDGTKIQVKTYHGRIRYNGASLEISGSIDSAGMVSANLAFNAGATAIELTIAGFTNAPAIQTTKSLLTSYETVPSTVTNTLITFQFLDNAGAQIVTGAEDTNMDFHVFIIGF